MADSQGHVTDPQLALIGDWGRDDHRRAACISCNGCLRGLGELKPLECVVAG